MNLDRAQARGGRQERDHAGSNRYREQQNRRQPALTDEKAAATFEQDHAGRREGGPVQESRQTRFAEQPGDGRCIEPEHESSKYR